MLTDHQFLLFEYQNIEEFLPVCRSIESLAGFSVTSPHKENIIPLLDHLDEDAAKIGAVNCVKVEVVNGSKKMTGYNTDYFGFLHSLKPFLEPRHERALVLGTGGAAKAVAFALKKIGVDVWYVTRKKKNQDNHSHLLEYEELNQSVFQAFKLIVNATPSEMLNGPSACPLIKYEYLSSEHLCYDLIYQPEATEFIRRSKMYGAATLNGLDMLYAQAEKAWSIWNS